MIYDQSSPTLLSTLTQIQMTQVILDEIMKDSKPASRLYLKDSIVSTLEFCRCDYGMNQHAFLVVSSRRYRLLEVEGEFQYFTPKNKLLGNEANRKTKPLLSFAVLFREFVSSNLKASKERDRAVPVSRRERMSRSFGISIFYHRTRMVLWGNSWIRMMANDNDKLLYFKTK